MISSMYAVKSLPLAPPSWPILLGARDQHLDLNRKLVSVPVRPARSISQRFRAAVVAAAESLVAGLAGDAELAAVRFGRVRQHSTRKIVTPFASDMTRSGCLLIALLMPVVCRRPS